jgi:LacI family transcriptional regulator
MSDVAAQAGVSIKTVSNVINDWPYVADETRQKVLEAVEAVGYRPNQMARSLVTGETKTVGVLVPDISNPFFGAAICGIEDVLFEGEYSIFLCNTNEDSERERHHLDQLLSRGVDGLVLWGLRICREELEEIVGNESALVTISLRGRPMRPNHTCIDIDHFDGAKMATQHLIDQGYRRIAHVSGPPDRVPSQLRFEGYEAALKAARLTPEPGLIDSGRPTIEGGFRAAKRLLLEQRPDAIFSYNDLIAVGALLAAKHLGVQVPQYLGIVGFDDLVISSLVEPPLTTVRIRQYELGRLAGQMILDHLQHEEPNRASIRYPVELRIRASSDRGLFAAPQRESMLEDLISHLADSK